MLYLTAVAIFGSAARRQKQRRNSYKCQYFYTIHTAPYFNCDANLRKCFHIQSNNSFLFEQKMKIFSQAVQKRHFIGLRKRKTKPRRKAQRRFFTLHPDYYAQNNHFLQKITIFATPRFGARPFFEETQNI